MSGAKVDPFAKYPVDVTPDLNELLRQCKLMPPKRLWSHLRPLFMQQQHQLSKLCNDDANMTFSTGYLPWQSDFRGPERHLFPVSRFGVAMRSGYTDVTLFIALLSLVATQLSMLRNGEIDELALKLQNKAIRLQAQSCRGVYV